jgi:hypothetical protein
MPYITLLLGLGLIAKLGSETAPNSEVPRPLKVRFSYVLFCNIYVYTKIKIFGKNGKRSTQEEADEIPQVRQEDNEKDH